MKFAIARKARKSISITINTSLIMAKEIRYYLCNSRREVLYQYGCFTSLETAEIKFRTILYNTSGDCPVCGIRAFEEEV